MKAADLKKLSRKELETLKARIDTQLEKMSKLDMKAALEAAQKAAKAHGYSLEQLTGGASAAVAKAKASAGKKPKKAAGSVNPPKYRNPENADQTWTGKGRRPAWIVAAQEKGVDIETMAI